MAKSKDTKMTMVIVHFDDSKVKALRQYMGRKNLNLEEEMREHMAQLYLRYVPQSVREFILFQDEDETKNGEA